MRATLLFAAARAMALVAAAPASACAPAKLPEPATVPSPAPRPTAAPATTASAAPAAIPSDRPCDPGTRRDGARCVAASDSTCPPGLGYQIDVGCVTPEATTPTERSYRGAMAALAAWRGPDRVGTGPDARARAFAALSAFHQKHASDEGARVMVIEIAYQAADLLHTGDERDASSWYRKVMEAFERLAQSQPAGALAGTRPAHLTAAAELALIDRDAWETFDWDSGHLRYAGKDVAKSYAEAKRTAGLLDDRLRRVLEPRYGAPAVMVEAMARQASLYDSLATSLGQPDVTWSERRPERAAALSIAVRRRGQAIALARQTASAAATARKAWKRLGELGLTDEQLRAMLAGIDGFTYRDGMFAEEYRE